MRPTLGNLTGIAAAIVDTKGARTTAADIHEFFPDQSKETILRVLVWALRCGMIIESQRETIGEVKAPHNDDAGPLLRLMEGGKEDSAQP